MIRVALPTHLRTLAHIEEHEVLLDVGDDAGPSIATVLDALEERYPTLQGMIRDHDTRKRRAFIRFFACEEDLSHDPPEKPLPEPVTHGKEPLLVVGAMAGG